MVFCVVECIDGDGPDAPAKTCDNKVCKLEIKIISPGTYEKKYSCSRQDKDGCEPWNGFIQECFCKTSKCDPFDKKNPDPPLPPPCKCKQKVFSLEPIWNLNCSDSCLFAVRCKVGLALDGPGSASMMRVCGKMDVNACIVIIEDYSNGATRNYAVTRNANIVKFFLCDYAVKEGCENEDLNTLLNTSHIPDFVHPKRKRCACKTPGCDPDPGNSGYRVIPAWPLTTFLLAVAISVALRYA